MFNFLMFYYIMVLVFIGMGGTLTILTETDVLPSSGRVNYLKLIFMYQYAVYKLAKDSINIVGIILLELLTTLSVWFLNIAVFVFGCIYYIGLFICKTFYFIFRKRNRK